MPGDAGPILVLAGPTACGKTDAGVLLAERLGTEIISADSVQVFRGFDLGSAKPPAALLARVRHHLLDAADPSEEFNAARFRDMASAIAGSLWSRGRIPLVVGGTGLYIKALSEGLSLSERVSPEAEEEMERLRKLGGQKLLYERLAAVDPQRAGQIHPNDSFRTWRGLGVYLSTGSVMSAITAANPDKKIWDALIVVMNPPRDVLYQRIAARTDKMLENGWLDEVNRLKEMGYNMTVKPMRAIGYKEVYALSEGRMDFQQARNAIIKGTKALARRQLTWFRKASNAVFLPITGDETASQVADKVLRLNDAQKFLSLYGVKI